RPHGLDVALSIAASGRLTEPAPVFDAVVQSRAIVLDELAARARSSGSVDPELASLQAALTAARQRFANIMLRSLEGEETPRDILEDARRQKEAAETELAGKSAAVRAELAHDRAGLADVLSALPPDTALASFVRYQRTVASSTGLRTIPSYVAFVAR